MKLLNLDKKDRLIGPKFCLLFSSIVIDNEKKKSINLYNTFEKYFLRNR